MITDGILQMVVNAYRGLISILPTVPDSWTNWVDTFWGFVMKFDYFIPVQEFVAFIPVIGAVYLALAVYRTIRFVLPGG